jgi:hypothetical protein
MFHEGGCGTELYEWHVTVYTIVERDLSPRVQVAGSDHRKA